jgi:hypothetical protein
MENTCKASRYPATAFLRGFFSFSLPEQIETDFASVGKFAVRSEHSLSDFLSKGSESPDIRQREAQNIVTSMFRQSWESFCREKGLYQHAFSQQLAFHVTEAQMPLGKRISWGRQGKRRNSMLRNIAANKVWQYGASAVPSLWPLPHLRIKSRVLFAELAGKKAGAVFEDSDLQHRYRRTVCKGWRNKAWHGRLMAFLELLSGESPYIDLPLSRSESLRLDATPILVTAPVTTVLPDAMPDDGEEQDATTLGNFRLEDDE